MEYRHPEKAAEVAVFLPLRQTFFYKYAQDEEEKLKPGIRVVVPFRNRDVIGVFLKFGNTDIETKKIKSILDDQSLFTEIQIELALWVAKYYLCGIGEIFRIMAPKSELKKRSTYFRGQVGPERLKATNRRIYEILTKPLSAKGLAAKAGLALSELQKKANPLVKKGILVRTEEFYFPSPRSESPLWDEESPAKGNIAFSYMPEQTVAIEYISSEISKKTGKTILLFGVTGSGKTEVYISLCRKVLENGESAIVLVPEIALTFQLVKRFFSNFGKNIALLHSGLTSAQRRNEWMRARSGEAKIVIGARSAIFAPLKDLGLIVVDEEHDASYKQAEYPHYNARDIAVVLGKMTGASVVLGSATPSLESFYNAKEGKYGLCTLSRRVDQRPMPKVEVIPEEIKEKRILPTKVIEKILDRFNKKEQSLIFINRRGASNYLKCQVCNEVLECPNCSITLTYHSAGNKRLFCHYCGHTRTEPFTCSRCGIGKTFVYRGVGTQKVESFLKQVFSRARVERLDQDTAPNRAKAFKILERFESGQTDILVGTQMTAKGHDFENLTFSAIVGADDYLAFPDFRSAERTFALITQAAGRTGRGKKEGEVIINGEADHYAIRHAVSHDYESFFTEELKKRRITDYPPFTRLIGLMFDSNSESLVNIEMKRLAANMPHLPSGVVALGPMLALIYKLRNRYRWKMLLKGRSSLKLHNTAVKIANLVDPRISVSVNVDPIGFY